MAASHLSLLTAGASKDQLIVCSSDVYGNVYSMVDDICSFIVNPARTTHRWLNESELSAIGTYPETFRMSVGIDNIEDLKEDLDQALKACQ
jgi:O-acetylhomoserine (thiol)-lyase